MMAERLAASSCLEFRTARTGGGRNLGKVARLSSVQRMREENRAYMR